MATILLGATALYVLYQATAGASTKGAHGPTPPDVKKAFTGNLDTQNAYWDKAPFQAQHHGKPPYAVRQPRPSISNTSNLVGEEYQVQAQDELEFRRQQIADTEPESIAFRGDRAEYWPDRERRRVPRFNHPNSGFTLLHVPPESKRVYPIVQPPQYSRGV